MFTRRSGEVDIPIRRLHFASRSGEADIPTSAFARRSGVELESVDLDSKLSGTQVSV